MFGFCLSEIFAGNPKIKILSMPKKQKFLEWKKQTLENKKNMIVTQAEQKIAAAETVSPGKIVNIKDLIESDRADKPDLSTKNLENEELKMKINFVRKFFLESLRSISITAKVLDTKNEEIEILWEQVVKSHISRNYFNFDYLYDTLNLFKSYCQFKNEVMCDYVILAIILQRTLGINETCLKNGNFIYEFLTKKLGLYHFHADNVREIIHSARTVDMPATIYLKSQYFHDLQLSRLGTDYISFIFIQRKLITENPHLTGREFFLCQRAIFKKLLEGQFIYKILFFRDKYETQAQENIKKYLECIDHKLLHIGSTK